GLIGTSPECRNRYATDTQCGFTIKPRRQHRRCLEDFGDIGSRDIGSTKALDFSKTSAKQEPGAPFFEILCSRERRSGTGYQRPDATPQAHDAPLCARTSGREA